MCSLRLVLDTRCFYVLLQQEIHYAQPTQDKQSAANDTIRSQHEHDVTMRAASMIRHCYCLLRACTCYCQR